MAVHRQLLESRSNTAELLEPADALLGDAPTTVDLAVKLRHQVVPSLLVFLVRDYRLDFLFHQPVHDPLQAVALVSGKLLRLVPPLSLFAPSSDQARGRTSSYLRSKYNLIHARLKTFPVHSIWP